MSALLNRLIRVYAIAYIRQYKKHHDADEAYVGAIVALCFFCFFMKADEVIYDIYWR